MAGIARWLAPSLTLLLAGCGAEEATQQPVEPDNMIACALGPGAEFVEDCSVERSMEGGRGYLTLWHSDGSFRRLMILSDGQVMETADGADRAIVTQGADGFEVALADNRYLIPRAVMGDGGR